MRYPEDKIKEAILHPDPDVRDTAICYFDSSTNSDDTLMPLAIQAIELYGRTKAFSFTHYLNLLQQTEQTIGWVIAELQRDCEGRPDEQHFYYLNLSRLLCHADIRLVAQHAPAILHTRHFDPKEQVAFRERLEMFGWNAEKCWQELHQYCEANKDKNNLEEFDLDHALRIVEALARQPHEYQRQIVALLAEKVRDFRHHARKWLQPLMANLAGEMRLHEAIPPLVGNLGHPYSFLADQSMFGLARIGSDDVVAAVCDQFPHGSRDFRLWASDLLCKIHLDSTVQRVLELLPGETDLAVRLNLCEALLDHFSDEGIEPVRRLIKEQPLTPDLRRLRLSLITVCKIMGSCFSEFDVWQEQAKKDAPPTRRVIRTLPRPGSCAPFFGNRACRRASPSSSESAKRIRVVPCSTPFLPSLWFTSSWSRGKTRTASHSFASTKKQGATWSRCSPVTATCTAVSAAETSRPAASENS
jgi:hypothetical protein